MPDNDAALALSLARWLGHHAMAAYLAGLVVVMVSTVLFWTLVHRVRHHIRPLPMPPTASLALVLAAGFGVVLAAGALFAEMMEVFEAGDRLGLFDEVLIHTLARSLSPQVLQGFAIATRLGDSETLVGIVVGVALLLAVRGRRWLALGWTASCALNGVLNQALKRLFERVRPVHDHGFAAETSYSFPSGHSSGSMVVYGLLVYLGLRLLPPRWHLPLILAAATLVFTIGVSRVMLQVHWATDVAAGFGSGLAWLAVSVLAIEVLRRQRGT